ncbi:MAG TPA: SDR family oxidoreductase [Xanthomonadaceae bacterium]|nr:SDR family oxidoreductase [Xanthomonadaceae bacterium]
MARQALVTGANRGLGLEFTRQLLARGERVVAACRHPGRAGALNELTGEHPGRLHVLPVDVTNVRSIQALARELPLVAERIDLLINNAGVLVAGERWPNLAAEHLEASFRTNAAGAVLLTQALDGFLAQGARVANLSSRLGSLSETGGFGTPSYAISKAAQNMATAQMAGALAERGIVVVALHPGWVRTDMGGEKAELPPEDSVRGLLAVIDGLTAQDSGRFLDWRGEPVAW